MKSRGQNEVAAQILSWRAQCSIRWREAALLTKEDGRTFTHIYTHYEHYKQPSAASITGPLCTWRDAQPPPAAPSRPGALQAASDRNKPPPAASRYYKPPPVESNPGITTQNHYVLQRITFDQTDVQKRATIHFRELQKSFPELTCNVRFDNKKPLYKRKKTDAHLAWLGIGFSHYKNL